VPCSTPLVYLLFAVLGLTLFFGTVPLLIAIKLGDKSRVERLLDLYIEVFAAGASAIIGALKIFRRREMQARLHGACQAARASSGHHRLVPNARAAFSPR
jgi:hypothetical protein